MSEALYVRRLASDELTATEDAELRELMRVAFADDEDGAFTEKDWAHALGGVHFVLSVGGAIVTHASVIERSLHIGGRPLRTGYVEAVATAPAEQGRGYGTVVMREVNSYISDCFELGALGTGSQGFYERLGWQIWRGPSAVRASTGEEPTPDEDGHILVLATPQTPTLDLTAPITCEWRIGDVW